MERYGIGCLSEFFGSYFVYLSDRIVKSKNNLLCSIAVGLTFCSCSERQYEKKEYVVSLKSFLINMVCAIGVVLGLFIIFLLDFSDYIEGHKRIYFGVYGLILFGASFCGWLFTGAEGCGSLSHGGF